MGDLRVELYGAHIGDIVGTHFREFDFVTSRDAFRTFPLGATILSESVPLEAVPNRGRAARRRNFFTELLPEGTLRTYLAEQAGLQEWDTVGFLARYGRDVAGALQIYDPDAPGEPRTPFVTDINEAEIAALLREVRKYPLGNTKRNGKSLINGVQAKLLLTRQGDEWKHPGDGYPSTHILKPQLDGSETTIFDEEYGARIARHLGLSDFDTHLDTFDGIATLVIERYDRSDDSPDGRIHQEDMNQVLGASGNEKYEKYSGGKVTMRRIADTFTKRGGTGSVNRLATMNILAVAVGNLDLHAKNISMLHPIDTDASLAPTYDVVPMSHLDNDKELAITINAKRLHAQVTAADLAAEFESWGVRGAQAMVLDRLADIQQIIETELPIDGAYSGLHRDVTRFTANLLGGKPAGGGATH